MNRDGFKKASADPSAGVPRYPRRILCPRCGFVKGTTRDGPKPGLCRACKDAMTVDERIAWAA